MKRPAEILRDWIRAADAIKPTCLNFMEFEALIRYQKERLSRFMTEDTKTIIKENIDSLIESADELAAKEHYGPAIHLMMAAREECVKWILVHC